MVRAVLACRHAAMPMPRHHQHHDRAPSGSPCFCTQMVGTFDQVLSVAVSAVEVVPQLLAVPTLASHHASLVPLPPSPAFAPETPPPIAA